MAALEPKGPPRPAEPARVPRRPSGAGRGQPVADELRAVLGPIVGHDLSGVRVHDNASGPTAVGAEAYTVGSDIVISPSQHPSDAEHHRKVLVHELMHAVQAQRHGVGPGMLSQPSDPAEIEAAGAVAAVGWGGLRAGYPKLARDVEVSDTTRPPRPHVSLTRSPAMFSPLQLTYDDGPDTAGNTRRVLDALNSAGARATFYLVGMRVVQGDNWRIVFDMAAAGHWIGNHAYDWNDASDNHIFLHGTVQQRAEKILQTEWAIRDALIKGREDAQRRKAWDAIPAANRAYVADVIAYGTGRFRTPGFRSHIWTSEGQATRAALASVNQVLAATGLRPLRITEIGLVSREGVDVDPEDWRKGRTGTEITKAVTSDVSSDDESVLLHSRITATAEATPGILSDFAKRNLRYEPTVQGAVGSVRPRPGFAGLATISDPPTSAEMAKVKGYFRSRRSMIGPYLSGSLAIGIFQLAQRAGPKEVDDFIAEIRSTTVDTPTGVVRLANWMAVNPEWSLFLGFFENWRLAKPFHRTKGVTP